MNEVKILAVSNDSYYKPDEALHELQMQETIMKALVDVQVVLRILVDKEIVTREEVQKYRNEVSNSPKYKPVLDDIQRQKRGFQAAKDNPQEYLKAIFNAKMNGDKKWFGNTSRVFSIINYKDSWKKNGNKPRIEFFENGGRRKNGDKCFDVYLIIGYTIFNYCNYNL